MCVCVCMWWVSGFAVCVTDKYFWLENFQVYIYYVEQNALDDCR